MAKKHNAALAHAVKTQGLGLGQGVLGALTKPATNPFQPAPGTVGPLQGSTLSPSAAPGAAPSGGSAQIVPDAQYLAQAAQLAFDRTTTINRLTQEGTDDRANAAEAIRRMLADAPGQRQSVKEGANKEGLFYSGQLSKRLDTFESGLTRAQADINTPLQQRDDARTAAITAINQGAPIEDAVALAGAGTRQIARDTSAADLNALVPNVPNVPASTAVPTVKQLVTKPPAAYQTKQGSGGVWHIYPNGKKPVWVPKHR